MNRCQMLMLALPLIAGCATSVPATHHYLLTGPEADSGVSEGAASLTLAGVSTAAYLQTQGIVIRTTETEVETARHHRWAEPLPEQLRRRIPAHLGRALPRIQIFTQHAPSAGPRLFVHFDRFNGHFDGAAIVGGTWHLESERGELLVRRHFTVRQPLTDDGYPALISALSAATADVVDDIAGSLAPVLADGT
ncbi:PqiC family protein [Spectribacter hydrogenooxidans]|uniref:ABC-type transport auxiliary lipoprotein family protein n=1 Tax=Spectribacter hydrogenoxidans TaxID=3075608 RepID=A0ABU3C2A9_9GAMM|nr:ABC-type transport auxiliary lipoprotein family protein [Salinisphaera sp. W335]MDT0635688.1 ABC-type transport auxiliary lipoprotein family protein [Salinisphaera sp. W335]